MAKHQKRRRRARAEWVELLGRFDKSGISVREFCAAENVSPSSFQRWRARLGSVSAAEFTELAATPVPPASESWTLELALPNGACVRYRG